MAAHGQLPTAMFRTIELNRAAIVEIMIVSTFWQRSLTTDADECLACHDCSDALGCGRKREAVCLQRLLPGPLFTLPPRRAPLPLTAPPAVLPGSRPHPCSGGEASDPGTRGRLLLPLAVAVKVVPRGPPWPDGPGVKNSSKPASANAQLET